MAEADWTVLASSLSIASTKYGVSNGEPRPNGGGNFTFGFNSLTAAAGVVALYANQASFAPMAKGASIRAAIKRGVSGGPTNFAPFLFAGASSNDVTTASAYMLGLDDDDPHRIVIAKGLMTGGVPAVPAGTSSGGARVLKAGTETFLNNTWLHLRLDMIVNTNGDVILQAYRSDLTANLVTAPAWVPVPGCENFVDDALEVNSGSAPLTSGYGGFGFQSKDVTRRAYFDQLEVQRQL